MSSDLETLIVTEKNNTILNIEPQTDNTGLHIVTDISRWEEVGKAHGEFFGQIQPVATMVEVSALIDPLLMVEIEVEAIVEDEVTAD